MKRNPQKSRHSTSYCYQWLWFSLTMSRLCISSKCIHSIHYQGCISLLSQWQCLSEPWFHRSSFLGFAQFVPGMVQGASNEILCLILPLPVHSWVACMKWANKKMDHLSESSWPVEGLCRSGSVVILQKEAWQWDAACWYWHKLSTGFSWQPLLHAEKKNLRWDCGFNFSIYLFVHQDKRDSAR